jgi:signal transduction histidine kinase
MATRIDVRMEIRDGYAVLSVADDGIGFDDTNFTAGRGAGLIGLRERFELLGGRVEFDANPGSGARVRACVPLEEPEEASI